MSYSEACNTNVWNLIFRSELDIPGQSPGAFIYLFIKWV